MNGHHPASDALLSRLANLTAALDATGRWPEEQFRLLAEAGILGWVIPREFGGGDIMPAELIAGYARLASACLTTAFILTQRNGACQRIAASQNAQLKAELLPRLARGETFATVGISHLTTSRQHWHTPTVQVEAVTGGWRFHGEVPWVTGAPQAGHVVTGGTLSDGRQLLAAIPAGTAGVTVGPAARLLALSASQTASIRLDDAIVSERCVLFGPVEQVMKQGAGAGTGSLATSALALGLSQAALRQLAEEAVRRVDLAEILDPLSLEYQRLSATVEQAALLSAAANDPSLSAESIRTRANSLVLRTTQALLAVSKGAGFVAGHPAERAVREAMFFLVWSCPQPVLTATLRELAGM